MFKVLMSLAAVAMLTVACSSDDNNSPANTVGTNTVQQAANPDGTCKQEVVSDFQSYNQRMQAELPELQNILVSLQMDNSAANQERHRPAIKRIGSTKHC